MSSPLKRGARKWGIAFLGSPSEKKTNGPVGGREEIDISLIGFETIRVPEAERHG